MKLLNFLMKILKINATKTFLCLLYSLLQSMIRVYSIHAAISLKKNPNAFQLTSTCLPVKNLDDRGEKNSLQSYKNP